MHSHFRTRLLNREPLIGTLLTLPSPEIAELCAQAGFDWLFLDMEHGALDWDDVQRMVQAVGERCACLVRVPGIERVWISRVLDIGVAGLIVPQVNTAEDAARAVQFAKYPPQGTRGVGLARAQGYGARLAEYLQAANEATSIVIQIETAAAAQNVEAIAAVQGVDALLIGPFDLSTSIGKAGQFDDPEFQTAVARVRAVAAAHRLPLGIFGPDLERGRRALADGYTLVPVASDTAMLLHSMWALVQTLRGKSLDN